MQQSYTRADLSRLSLNQMTTQRWSLREAVEGCLEAGVPNIALRRERVAEIGLPEAARVVREADVRVSSLHVGGRFPAASEAERRARLDDNRRAVEEAAELGAEVLSLLAGAAPECGIDATRAMVEEGIEQIIPDAEQSGVKLAVEPLHPVFAAERSSGRIVGFHINDWPVPNEYPLMSRAMMGDGVIELRRIRSAVDGAGYTGPIEVEIFNQAIWDTPGKVVLTLMKDRYVEHVL
jgi:sugar phosphate isomerase/epimerase